MDNKYYLQSIEVNRDPSIGVVARIFAEYTNGFEVIKAKFEYGEQIPTIVNREGEEV